MAMMPNFLVIGAARSGTTALYTYLRQHPDVFMSPRKEANFFAFENEVLDFEGPGPEYVNNSINALADYQALFDGVANESAIGEASPLYLYSENAPQRIYAHVPDIKLIAILRNPIEQAFSHYLYAKRQVLEPLDDFMAALQAENQRKQDQWQPLFQYSQFPKYHQQLQRYYDIFPAEQIRIYLYEDFQSGQEALLKDIFSFIGVDETFAADLTYRPNAGGIPKSRLLQDLVMKPHAVTNLLGRILPEDTKRRIRDAISSRNLETPKLAPAAREHLRAELSEDIQSLQSLIGRDLSHWLN
jgi:hypothetical protein